MSPETATSPATEPPPAPTELPGRVNAVLEQIEAAFGEPLPAVTGHSRTDLAERLAERTRQAKIMIIDDDALTVEALRQFLADAGFARVIGTPRTEKALWLATQEKPDMILLDVFMPGGNGLGILEQMRRTPELARVPVVMVTASVDYQTKLTALRRGATDFLNKPVHPEELIARVTNILRAAAHAELLRDLERETRLAAQRELEQAESIQMRLFPTQSPQTPVLDIAGVVHSAGTGCGDYFDFLSLPDGKLGVVVGDVSGHGMPAAWITGWA